MVVNAALYPPACPTRIRKSRLVIPIEKHLALEGFCIQPLLSPEKVERSDLEREKASPQSGIVANREGLQRFGYL
jgi:hypothetical protein